MQKNSRGSKYHSQFSKIFLAFYSDVRHDGDIIVFTLRWIIGEICSGDSVDDTSLITTERTVLGTKVMVD